MSIILICSMAMLSAIFIACLYIYASEVDSHIELKFKMSEASNKHVPKIHMQKETTQHRTLEHLVSHKRYFSSANNRRHLPITVSDL